jgi:hypothetical protein
MCATANIENKINRYYVHVCAVQIVQRITRAHLFAMNRI